MIGANTNMSYYDHSQSPVEFAYNNNGKNNDHDNAKN